MSASLLQSSAASCDMIMRPSGGRGGKYLSAKYIMHSCSNILSAGIHRHDGIYVNWQWGEEAGAEGTVNICDNIHALFSCSCLIVAMQQKKCHYFLNARLVFILILILCFVYFSVQKCPAIKSTHCCIFSLEVNSTLIKGQWLESKD